MGNYRLHETIDAIALKHMQARCIRTESEKRQTEN